MNTEEFTSNLTVKVAWYYYIENLTQNEISDILSLSRNKVVRLLEKARADGIVQFQIKGKDADSIETELALKKKFGLSDAFVIPESPRNLNASLARAAAQYMDLRLNNSDLIGLGWGDTVSRTAEYLAYAPGNEYSVVTLTGGANYYINGGNFVDKFGGRINIIPAPFLASSENMARQILKEPSVIDTLSLVKLSKFNVVGIGGLDFEQATFFREEKMSTGELLELRSKNAVGDILGQFYSSNGAILDLAHHKRVVGLPIEELKTLNNVIGVAGGAHKIDSIFGALKGGYINILITDEKTAKSLLQKEADVK